MSSVMPNLYMKYRGRRYRPNLTTLIVGGPASDKGIANDVKEMLYYVDESKRKGYNEVHSTYVDDKTAYDKDNDGAPPCQPIKPVHECHDIAASSSYVYFLTKLKTNQGEGFLFSSEFDTLSASFESSYGDYSVLVRQTWGNEDHEYGSVAQSSIRIKDIRFSLLVTGTPNQIQPLVGQLDNGLYSRFLYYITKSNFTVDNPFSISTDYRQYIRTEVAPRVLDLYGKLNGTSFPIDQHGRAEGNPRFHQVEYCTGERLIMPRMIQLIFDPATAGVRLQQILQEKLSYMVDEADRSDMTSVILRWGVELCRVAGVIAVCRAYDNPDFFTAEINRGYINVTEKDFELAHNLTLLCQADSIRILDEMHRQSPVRLARNSTEAKVFAEYKNLRDGGMTDHKQIRKELLMYFDGDGWGDDKTYISKTMVYEYVRKAILLEEEGKLVIEKKQRKTFPFDKKPQS